MDAPTRRLEASVTHSICTQLENLGWVVDEQDPENNVTQQRAKTEAQKEKLKQINGGVLRYPDFVLYERGTSSPVAVIEAKRPGESLAKALNQAQQRYARPLGAALVFAYNDTFVDTRHVFQGRALKIDGEDVRQFVDHYTSLRFINEGPEILSAPYDIQLSRQQLLKIFKQQANLLREAGLQAGLERFGAFSDILFLKLMDELCTLREHAGEAAPLPDRLRWSEFVNKRPTARLEYARNVVWREMNERFGSIFGHTFPIQSPEIFHDIVEQLSSLNFTGTDSDIKGDAFEYFLRNAYQGIKIKDLGEYFTPRNIVRTMVSMVDPRVGEKVYDPFCGTGGFLIESFRYIALRSNQTPSVLKILKNETVYGREITQTARVAKMNMILYGDGHSNVWHEDSFAKPQSGKYDVVLTNPPYSQKTRHGNLYSVPTQNGDAISVQHCLDALKPNGRAAILIKEDFLTDVGDVGSVRKMLFRAVKDLSVVSLPRRLFEPYTPTKTSILCFRKNGTRKKAYFFVVRDVGHTFGARKRSLPQNDLPAALEGVRDPTDDLPINVVIAERDEIVDNDCSLWCYDYAEVLPPTTSPEVLKPLGDHIRSSGTKFAPSDSPDETFQVLGVSNTLGVFLNEEKLGSEINQKYIAVQPGDLVYNPHRVNVGSLGMVPAHLDGGIVSGIYVVFRPRNTNRLPSAYLYHLLRTDDYLNVIRAYDTRHGAVRANLVWSQLCRIKIILPSPEEIATFRGTLEQTNALRKEMLTLENRLTEIVKGYYR